MGRRQLRTQWQMVAAQAPNSPVTDADKQPLKILLVDDDEDDYIITRDLLAEIKGNSFHLDWVETYQTALETIVRNQHDVYLIDYRLGERNGLELLSEVIARGSTAPLILLTGQGDRVVDVEAMRRGASDYLVKGAIDAPSLERSIRYAIERKQAEQTLRESEHFIRTIFSSVGEGIVVFDRNLHCQMWNNFMEELTGLPEEQALGRSATSLFSHPPQPGGEHPLQQALIGEVVSPPYTPFYIPETGKEGWMVAVYTPHRTPEGEIIGVVATIRDITERKQVEEALRESEKKYRTLIERMSEGLLQVDNNGLIQFVNDRFCEMVGYARDELLGKPASELLSQAGDQFLTEKEIRPTPENTAPYETQLRMKSGETIWVRVGVAPVIDAENKVIGSVRIHADITERKQAEKTRARLEEHLRQSQKMEAVGTLAGGIAHDFNNLLTAIMGYTGLALDRISPDEPPYHDILGIQKTAERATDLTRQLLAFARRQMVELRVLNLNDLILDMGKMLRRLIGENIELVTLPAPDLGLVKVDPGQFEQLLVNLAINARDAMPEGGKLIIETANVTLDRLYAQNHAEVIPGEYVMLAVTDNGIGMTEDIQDHIFEPFFTTKEVNKGTGLGLATCFGTVKQSNGHIWVYSEPGQGTSLKIYLPRMAEPETDSPFRNDPFGNLPRGTETILLVEDDPAVRGLASRILSQQGYHLLEASNGDEALRLVQKQPRQKIDLLITDVVMPQMGGKDLANRLKTIQPSFKVLFTSGYADNAIVQHGILEPEIDFLQKPFSLEMLIRKAREVLDKTD